jgi:hypothetical protein
MQLSQGYIYFRRLYFPTQQTNSIGKTETEGIKRKRDRKKEQRN